MTVRADGGAAAVAAVLALGACHGAAVARPGGAAGEGRTVVIHVGRDGAALGRAHVDDRRWRDVAARGELDLGPVPAQVELDSVVVESVSDPTGLRARSCHVLGASAGLGEPAWLWGRTVTVTLRGQAHVAGEVIEVGEPVAIIDDGEVQTAVAIDALHVEAGEGAPAHDGPPRIGDAVYAIDGDGEEVFGRFAAVRPDRLVLRVAGGRRRGLDVDAIETLTVVGVPAEPTLRCQVESARPGRHLVRVAYAAPDVAWQARYQLTLAPVDDAAIDHVVLTPAFAIDAARLPALGAAHVRLVLGTPSEAEPPLTVWEGEARLAGVALEVHGPAARRRARVDRVYRGALDEDNANPRYPDWHDGSTSTVWRELALERLPADAPGPLRVGLAAAGGGVRWIDGEVAPTTAATPARVVRVALEVDPDLVGFRRKRGRDPDGSMIIDDVAFSVANRGETARTVVVEEELRDVARPTVVFERVGDGHVGTGQLLRDRWRTTLILAPGELLQGQIVLQYRFKRY